MSTPLPPPPGYVSIEEFNQLRQQNEQLWKIIERQRTMIQNLQKENSHLSAERDGLQDNVNSFERIRKQRASILVSTEVLKAMSDIEDEPSPMPPPRSPYRANTIGKTDHQQQQQQRSKDKPINVDTTLENNNNNNNTIDTTSINNNNNNINPTSPKNLIMEKDASNMQKFKSVKPPIVPIPSISSPTITTAHNNNNSMAEESSLSSSFSSSTSSYLRPNSPPTNNQRNNQRSKRESHIFFSPPPLTTSMDAPAMPSLDSIDQINHIPVSSPSPTPPTPPPHHLPSSSSSSPSPSTTIQPQSTDNNNNHNPLATGITNISLKVLGSNIRQNEKGREVISFIISVGKKPDETNLEFEELWRVEKLYSHFLDLDAKIKSSRNKTAYSRIAKLPDKTLFTSHSPSKVDRRKAALENYLQHIVLLPPEDSSDLCEFLSTNVVDNDVMYSRTGRKEGYLTKRGKNFGGWKTRFFVLNGTNLDYYESKEGNHLGTIRLINAQIGRQTPQAAASASATDENNIYRHAFLIIEQKRAGSSQIARHILCAENDEDRDSWVDALFKHVRLEEDIALHPSDPSLSSSSFPSPAKKKSSISSTTSSSKPMASTSTPSTLPSSNKSSSSSSHPYHQQQDASEFDKLRTYQNSPSEIGMAVTGSTLTNDSSSSLTSTWSSSTSPPPLPPIVLDNYHHPLQQQNNNNNSISFSNSLQPHQPSHNLTRRSSMVNLLNKSQEEEITLPARAVSPSPAFGRSSDELLGDDLPEKKSKHKRMTFWGKKMFSSNTSESTAPFDTQSMHSNLSNHTTSTSNSTLVGSTTSSSANTLTTATTGSSSSGFRGFLSRPSNEQGRSHHHKDNQNQPQNPVFGVPLDDAVRISRVSDTYQLPSIVYRCIEYLDVKKAILEEGLYRLSGSNTMMKSLKLKFDQEGDINLLAAKEEYDVHAIAGLLKMWLRELPTSVLTRELRMDFLHVIDLLDRKDRVNELGRLVSLLPIANYTLLRALTAHLIQVVQHSDINKMTMRNVSIVFSPTLGIPGTIFNLLMSEFDYIFWTTEDGDAAPRMILDDENTEYETPIKIIEEAPPPPSINDNNNNYYNGNNINHQQQQQQQQSHPYDTNQQTNHPDHNNNNNNNNNSCSGKPLGRRPTLQLKDGRSNRNSINYREAAPNAIVDLEKHHSGQQALMLDEIEDEVNDLALSDDEDYSIISDDKLQPTAITI